MLILYKNERNVRFELFTKTEKNLHTNQQNEHTPGFIIVAVLFFDKCNRIFHKVLMRISTLKTRKHSSKLRTGRSLTVCRSLLPGGVSAPGKVCLLRGRCVCSGEGVSAPGGVYSRGVSAPGVSAPGDVSAPGGCLFLGGSGPGGVGRYPSMH